MLLHADEPEGQWVGQLASCHGLARLGPSDSRSASTSSRSDSPSAYFRLAFVDRAIRVSGTHRIDILDAPQVRQ